MKILEIFTHFVSENIDATYCNILAVYLKLFYHELRKILGLGTSS